MAAPSAPRSPLRPDKGAAGTRACDARCDAQRDAKACEGGDDDDGDGGVGRPRSRVYRRRAGRRWRRRHDLERRDHGVRGYDLARRREHRRKRRDDGIRRLGLRQLRGDRRPRGPRAVAQRRLRRVRPRARGPRHAHSRARRHRADLQSPPARRTRRVHADSAGVQLPRLHLRSDPAGVLLPVQPRRRCRRGRRGLPDRARELVERRPVLRRLDGRRDRRRRLRPQPRRDPERDPLHRRAPGLLHGHVQRRVHVLSPRLRGLGRVRRDRPGRGRARHPARVLQSRAPDPRDALPRHPGHARPPTMVVASPVRPACERR